MRRVEITLWPPSSIKRPSPYINIPEDVRHIFPQDDVRFKIETDDGEFGTHIVHKHRMYGKDHFHFTEWFKAHPELKPGDKVIIKVIEPMKKYRLELLTEEE